MKRIAYRILHVVSLCIGVSLQAGLIFGVEFESSNSDVPNGRTQSADVVRPGTDESACTGLFVTRARSVRNATDKDSNFNEPLPAESSSALITLGGGYLLALLVGLVVIAKGIFRIYKIHKEVNSILHGG